MWQAITSIRVTLFLVAVGLALNGIADVLEQQRLDRLEKKIQELVEKENHGEK